MPIDTKFFDDRHNEWKEDMKSALESMEKQAKKLEDAMKNVAKTTPAYKELSRQLGEVREKQVKYTDALEDTVKVEKESYVQLNQRMELLKNSLGAIDSYTKGLGQNARSMAEFNAVMANSADRLKNFANLSSDNIAALDQIRSTLKLTRVEFGGLVKDLEPLADLKIDFRDLDKLAKKLIEVRGYVVGSKEFGSLMGAEGKTRGLTSALANAGTNPNAATAYLRTGQYSREERLAIQDTLSNRKEEGSDAAGSAKDFEVVLDSVSEHIGQAGAKLAQSLTVLEKTVETLVLGFGLVLSAGALKNQTGISLKSVGSFAGEILGEPSKGGSGRRKGLSDYVKSLGREALGGGVHGGGSDDKVVNLLAQIAANTGSSDQHLSSILGGHSSIGGGGGIGGSGGGLEDLLSAPGRKVPPGKPGFLGRMWGRIGGFRGIAAKGIRGGLVGSLTSMLASSFLPEGSVGSSIANYAGIGAGLGSIIPGVGTLAGGAIGGAIGGLGHTQFGKQVGGYIGSATSYAGAGLKTASDFVGLTKLVKYFTETEKEVEAVDLGAMVHRYQESANELSKATDDVKNSFSQEFSKSAIVAAKRQMLETGTVGDLSGIGKAQAQNLSDFSGRAQNQLTSSITSVDQAKDARAKAIAGGDPAAIKAADEALAAAEATLDRDRRTVVSSLKAITEISDQMNEVKQAAEAWRDNIKGQMDIAKQSLDAYGALLGDYSDMEGMGEQVTAVLNNLKESSAAELKAKEQSIAKTKESKTANEKILSDLQTAAAGETDIKKQKELIAKAQAQAGIVDAERISIHDQELQLAKDRVAQAKLIKEAEIAALREKEDLYTKTNAFSKRTGSMAYRRLDFQATEKEQAVSELEARKGVTASKMEQASQFGTPTGLSTAYDEHQKVLDQMIQSEKELRDVRMKEAAGMEDILRADRERITLLRKQVDAMPEGKAKQDAVIELTRAEDNYTEQLRKKTGIVNEAQTAEAKAIQAETEGRNNEIKKSQEVLNKKNVQYETEKFMLEQNISMAEKMGASYPAILDMEKKRIAVMEQQRTALQTEISNLERGMTADQQAVSEPLQAMRKQLKTLTNDITSTVWGQNRNFMDKALGSMFGVSNGSTAQPVLNNRLIAGGSSYVMGMNGEIMKGKGMTKEERVKFLRPNVPGAFGTPADPAAVAQTAFKDAKEVAHASRDAFKVLEAFSKEGIALNIKISGSGADQTAVVENITQSESFKVAIRQEISKFATRPA